MPRCPKLVVAGALRAAVADDDDDDDGVQGGTGEKVLEVRANLMAPCD